MMIHCNRCKKYLPQDYFGSDKSRISGKSIYCKQCRARLAKEKRKLKPKADSIYRKLRRYGLTEDQYQKILKEQDFACQICKTKEPSSVHTAFYIDHDHATGEVRGLLCRRCNLILGYANDNLDILEASIAYLKKYSTKG